MDAIYCFTVSLRICRRGRYDRGEDLDEASMPNFDPQNIFQMFFSGGRGPPGFHREFGLFL